MRAPDFLSRSPHPAKSGRTILHAALLGLVPAVLVLAGCSPAGEPSPPSPTPPAPAPAVENTRVFTLRYAQAVEIADIIIELHDASKRAAAARASRVEGQPGSVPTEIRVVPDASANTLTVTVAPDHLEDLARISELIARLDVDVRPGR